MLKAEHIHNLREIVKGLSKMGKKKGKKGGGKGRRRRGRR